MRTVFTNSMCAHVWAQLKQPHGRSGSMKFDGSVAYSYWTPVANLIKPYGKDEHVALFVPNRWGVTTAQHLRHYQSAARGRKQFTVPDIFAGHETIAIRDNPPREDLHGRNLDSFTDAYQNERDSLMRVPAESWRLADCEDLSDSPFDRVAGITRAHVRLRELAEVMTDYCEAFGIRAPVLPWQADADKAIERRKRLENDPKRAEKRAKAAEARERAQERARERAAEQRRIDALESVERVKLWRAGAPGARLHYSDVPRELGAALRIVGDTVETSQGATVPLEHARQVFRFWRYLVDAGKVFPTGNPTAHVDITLGHFRLDAVDADGNVRAGCHELKRAELEAFGELLKLAQ